MALFHCNFFSNSLGMSVSADVLLPQRTADADSDAKIPVLYLLHGLSDDQTIWQRKTSIERYAEAKGIAVIMPTTNRAWYTDSPAGRYFTYVSYELPRIMHGFFPQLSTAREQTFIAGLSMGGYGAYKIALTHPDAYACAASLSGALDVARLRLPGEKDLIFGTRIEGTKNDLFWLSEAAVFSKKPLPRLYQWCGMQDSMYADNVRFSEKVAALGYETEVSFTDGNHTWDCWDREIQKVINWLPVE